MRLAKNSDVLIHLSSHNDVGDLDISIYDFVPNNIILKYQRFTPSGCKIKELQNLSLSQRLNSFWTLKSYCFV